MFSSAALIIWGLVAVSSASAVISYERFGHNNYYFFRQIFFATSGFGLIYTVSRIDYHFWKKWSLLILLVSIVALGLVLIPGVGFSVRSARSWFKIGSFLVQPSEFVKLALIFYLAAWFERKKDAENNFWFGIIPPLLAAGSVIGLVVLEPDVGTAAILAAIVFALLFAAGTSFKYLGVLAAGAAGALWILVKTAPYRAARIVTFLDPSLDPRGIGYQINQALLAIGSGGLWGQGLGLSRQKHNYLPEPIGDSIFAVMAEELGFLRIIFLVALFLFFVVRGLKVAGSSPDKFGRLLAIGLVCWIGLQAFINIGAISNLLPLTGITLPFLSYGGSSLWAVSFAVGILLNISRQTR